MHLPLKSPPLHWALGLGLWLVGAGLAHAQPPGAPEETPVARALDDDARRPHPLCCTPDPPSKGLLPVVRECDVVVATVVAVHDEGSTHGAPPTVLLQVEEVITGDISPGLVHAVWSEHLHGWLSAEDRAQVAQWKAEPQRGPEVGARFLVAGIFNRSHRWFMTVPELRLVSNPEQLRALRSQVQRELEAWTLEHVAWRNFRRAVARAAARDDELMAAVVARDVTRVRALLREGVRATASNEKGLPALHEAARLGDVAVMEALLDAGAPVDMTEPPRRGMLRTALEVAAGDGHVEALELLLARGANLHHLSVGRTPIVLYTVSRGQCAVVKVLLAHGAQADQADGKGRTPLLDAAFSGPLDCVITLLEAGARPDKADDYGWRPVHYALKNPAVLEQLLRAGANPNARSPDGKRPLKMAKEQRLPDSARLLRAAGARE